MSVTRAFARLRDETLRRYGVSRVEDLPINYSGLVMQEGEKHTADAFEQSRQQLLDVYHRQARVVEWAGLLSPYLAMRHISLTLAGSDLAHQVEFERQAKAYRYRLIQSLNDLHIREVSYGQDRYGQITNGAPSRARIDASFFGRLRAFDYEAPGVWRLLGHGQTVIARRRAALAASPDIQAEEHRRVLAPLGPDAIAGDQLYYLFFHTRREPSVWAPVASGTSRPST
jgi:hypothetical protein